MISTLTSAMSNAVNAMNRGFSSLYTGGFSQLINDMLNAIANGNIGIQSAAPDVDSLCLGGGAFSYNADTTVGLTLGYNAGVINWQSTIVTYGAGTIALSASNTNYVEADRNGTVYANTAAFTAGRCRLYTVLCGVSSITTVTPAKTLLNGIAPAGLPGSLLSVPGQTRTVSRSAATINATTSFLPIVAPLTGVVSAASFLPDTAVATDNANYWTFSIVNLGQANAGTQAILNNASAANTTKTTGGTALAVNVPFPLTLATTTLAVNKGDLLIFTATKAGTATTIGNGHVSVDFTYNN